MIYINYSKNFIELVFIFRLNTKIIIFILIFIFCVFCIGIKFIFSFLLSKLYCKRRKNKKKCKYNPEDDFDKYRESIDSLYGNDEANNNILNDDIFNTKISEEEIKKKYKMN